VASPAVAALLAFAGLWIAGVAVYDCSLAMGALLEAPDGVEEAARAADRAAAEQAAVPPPEPEQETAPRVEHEWPVPAAPPRHTRRRDHDLPKERTHAR
jgi:hypothetical protein